jgi:hypothetical protein
LLRLRTLAGCGLALVLVCTLAGTLVHHWIVPRGAPYDPRSPPGVELPDAISATSARIAR